MIGIFDSGVGGFCAFREVRRLLPRENILYLADRRNAPYGTKTKEEIIALTEADIERLRRLGARKILIACCTASTVYDSLCQKDREIALPIITPTAEIVAKSARRVLVIATDHTARSSAFKNEISRLSQCEVFEMGAQRLVSLVEGGCRDGRINDECRREIEKIKDKIQEIDADCLILGCTHFSHLEGEFSRITPRIKIISPAIEGARALVRSLKQEIIEQGRIIYS